MEPQVKEAVDECVSADPYGDGGNKEGRAAALQRVVAALNSGKVQLVDLVLHLEPAMNDTSNPQGRRQAILLLADCIREPSNQVKLNFKHVETFVIFFLSKVGDWQCVEGAVTGLTGLLARHAPQLRTLTAKDGGPLVTEVARSMFKGVHTSSHTQHVRKCILDLVRLLLEDWRDEVVLLGEALGEGVHAVIEEERDPRNLLQAFAIVPRLLRDCPPTTVSNETLDCMFESLTSYFPITFTPPKDDKYGITGEDLKLALSAALAATPRMAQQVLPFVLDASKDITVGDNVATIRDALAMLGFCAERYGAAVVRAHLGTVLTTARDQVCRTTTPCPSEFATAVRRVLAVALGDVPAGLTPHWLEKEVGVFIKELVRDVGRGRSTLASDGSKRLLVAAAEAHPVLLQYVWSTALPPLLGPAPQGDGKPEALPRDALTFVLDLARAASAEGRPCPLAPKQLKSTLAAVVAALATFEPDEAPSADDHDTSVDEAFAQGVTLIGLLCQILGEGASMDAFQALRLLFVPAPPSKLFSSGEQVDSARAEWCARWRAALVDAEASDPRAVALLAAVDGVVAKQPARAAELAPALLAATPKEGSWLVTAMPGTLAIAAVCLAGKASSPPPEEPASANEKPAASAPAPLQPAAAGEAAEKLLKKATELLFAGQGAAVPNVLEALAVALEPKSPGGGLGSALGWVAGVLVGLLDLRPPKAAGLARMCSGFGTEEALTGVSPLRRFFAALCSHLPKDDGVSGDAVRRAALAAATAADGGGARAEAGALVLVPAALPGATFTDWSFAQPLMQTACRVASAPPPPSARPEAGPTASASLALEAVDAVIVAIPRADVPALLKNFRETFEPVLGGGGSDADVARARGAARCWAAAAVALLRRGGCADEAEAFLQVLLGALKNDGAPIAPYVSVAFQIMTPSSFEYSDGVPQSKLPPLALQQLSRTVLPSLMSSAKAAAAAAPAGVCAPSSAGRAALECAVGLLAALPPEVSCIDCKEDLRWCAMTGLKYLKEESSAAGGGGRFAVQALQLLIRAARRGDAWTEDDLASIVQAILGACVAHPVPLVRLGCFQALNLMTLRSQGHMLGFKKQIEQCLRKAVEDRKREVRLVASGCLNTWHCGLTAERD